MSNTENPYEFQGRKHGQAISPLIAAYTAFVTLASIVGLSLPIDVIERIAPYATWNPSLIYPLHIAILIYYWARRDARAVMILPPMLAGQIYIGIYDFVRLYGKDSAYPAMRVSGWRIVWTVIIPALWLIGIYHLLYKWRGKSTQSKNAA